MTPCALTSKIDPDDLKEIVLQQAIYCGVPAANSAFDILQVEFEGGK